MKSGHFIANVFARVVGRAGSIAANVVAIALMARALDATAFGQVMFLLTLVAIFVQVADFGTTTVMARLIVDHRERPGPLWASFMGVRAKLALVAMVLALAYALISGVKAPLGWVALAVLSIPLVAARFFDAVFQVFERTWSIAWSYLVFGGVLVALTALAAWLGAGGGWFLAACLVASAAYCMAALYGLRGVVPRGLPADRALRSRIWAMAMPLGIGALFTTLNSRASVMVVEYYRDAFEVALFVAALRVLDLAIAAAMIAIGPLLPAFSRASADQPRLRRIYCAVLKLVLVVMVPIVVAAPLWADPLVRLLYGEKYLASVPAVALIVVMGALALLNLLNSYVLLALHVVRFAAWLTGTAAALSMALNLWLVPVHGYMAAAMVSGGIEGLMLCVTFALLRRSLGPIFEARTWLPVALAGAVMATPIYGWPLPGAGWSLVAGLACYAAVVALTGLWRVDRQAFAG